MTFANYLYMPLNSMALNLCLVLFMFLVLFMLCRLRIRTVLRVCIFDTHTIQYLCLRYVEHVRSIRIPIHRLYSMQSEYFVSEARAETAVSRSGSLHFETNQGS